MLEHSENEVKIEVQSLVTSIPFSTTFSLPVVDVNPRRLVLLCPPLSDQRDNPQRHGIHGQNSDHDDAKDDRQGGRFIGLTLVLGQKQGKSGVMGAGEHRLLLCGQGVDSKAVAGPETKVPLGTKSSPKAAI
jgi:hypothetical protein